MGAFEGRNREETSQMALPLSQVIRNNKKLVALYFELLSHPPYAPDLTPSRYHLFENLRNELHKKMEVRRESDC